MDTLQILCTLRNVKCFLDVYASDLLPSSITKTCTVIVNADPHTKGGSHWLAVHFRPKSSYAYYFDSCGIVPFVPDILAFVKRNCTTWDRNRRQLQCLTSEVCGMCCCLFALYKDRGYTNQQLVALFNTKGRPTGGGDVHGRIWGSNASWRLGSMLPQLSIKGE